MQSGGTVVVVIRLAGRVFAVVRTPDGVRIRNVSPERSRTTPLPDQAEALKLVRK